MKKKNAASPRYIVVDTTTGEAVDYLGSQGKIPVHRGKLLYMGKTSRRLFMIASCVTLVFGVSIVGAWLVAQVPLLSGVLGEALVGLVSVVVAAVAAKEWFEIDERLEAFGVVAARAEHWEDAYFELAKRVNKENRQA